MLICRVTCVFSSLTDIRFGANPAGHRGPVVLSN